MRQHLQFVWRYRESQRFVSGRYRPVPVALDYPLEHYLHLSVTETETDTVAYTPSPEYGERDRQVRLKFGRYLKKVWPDMSDACVQAHVTALKSALSMETSAPVLEFATDRETITRIFETEMRACGSTAVSCMHDKFTGKTRPYHVYADSPDVAVAYVLSAGEIVSRSVVSTKDKVWVRAYSVASGDNDADCGTLKAMLKDAGYSKGDLYGSRLTKLETSGVMLPYIDNSGAYVRDAGKWWIVQSDDDGADYQADCTDGTATEVDSRDRCSTCEEYEDDCECSYCDCCQERYANGCDTCSTCEHCERCIYHNNCNCSRCSECHELIEHYRHCSHCECERCGECGELEDDCECSKCDECGRLEDDCECEQETETETIPAVDTPIPDETTLETAIRAIYGTATPCIPEGYESTGECRPGRDGEMVLGYNPQEGVTGAVRFNSTYTYGVQPRLILRAISELTPTQDNPLLMTTDEIRYKLNRAYGSIRTQYPPNAIEPCADVFRIFRTAFETVTAGGRVAA